MLLIEKKTYTIVLVFITFKPFELFGKYEFVSQDTSGYNMVVRLPALIEPSHYIFNNADNNICPRQFRIITIQCRREMTLNHAVIAGLLSGKLYILISI